MKPNQKRETFTVSLDFILHGSTEEVVANIHRITSDLVEAHFVVVDDPWSGGQAVEIQHVVDMTASEIARRSRQAVALRCNAKKAKEKTREQEIATLKRLQKKYGSN